MKTLFKNIGIFILVLELIGYPISLYISNHFHTYSKMNWILKQQNLQFDYAVLGSSKIDININIKTLNDSWGGRGINIGTSGSGYAENYIVLKEFLSKNKINKLILNFDITCFNSKLHLTYPFHDYLMLHLFNKYPDVFYDNITIWKYYLWNIIPISRYIEFNEEFFLKDNETKELDNTFGSELNDTRNKDFNLKFKKIRIKITESDKKYFMKILQLCNDKKIKVIFIEPPIYNNFFKYLFSNYASYSNFTHSEPNQLQIKCFKYKNLINSSDSNYFYNYSHLNKQGALIYSQNLGLELKRNHE